MTNAHWPNRYWGSQEPPKTKAEFFNAAVTAPPAPDGAPDAADATPADATLATIRMYGPIDPWGGWWGISAQDVAQVLDNLPDTVTQIILRINSPGGSCVEATAILNLFRAHKATVLAVVDGLAASAASVIAAGCDETVMSPGTQMMIHSPHVITWGNAAQLRKDAAVLDNFEAAMVEIYQAKAGLKDWAALLAEETWLTGAQAIELGLADRSAVVPDAGEAETAGDDVVVVVPLEDPGIGNAEDASAADPAARATRITITAARAASKLPSSSEPGDPNQKEKLKMSDTIKAGLRERLGVTDAAASDETLLAALDQALEEQADPPAAPAAALPDGFTAIDSTVLAELQENARLGAEARAEQESTRRDGIVKAALDSGRITPQSRAAIRAQLDKDEAGTSAFLATLPKNAAVPVTELGLADSITDADDSLYGAIYGTKEA